MNVVSPNKILISNFQNTSPNTEIALTLRMINPNSNGYTTPLKIITYTNSSQSIIVDQDLVSAKTTIELYTSSSGILSIIASNPLANREVTDLLFFIQPDVTIPAGGYFKIRVPDDFQLIIPFVATNCQLDYSGVSGTNWKNAQGCVVSGNVITIWNQNDLAFIKQTLGSFRVLAQVLTPTYNS